MRIVGGDLRGRRLEAPAGRGVRPTSERAREALFNILTQGRAVLDARGGNPLPGACVLDGFAGSGALGIEALSRGAAKAFFIEKDPEALAVLRRNLQKLGLGARARIMPADLLHPPRAQEPCDILLLDPPYGEGLAGPALEGLATAGWIAAGAIVSVEMARQEDFTPPLGLTLIEERHYGKAKLLILHQVAGES